jgi:hypothetical protein
MEWWSARLSQERVKFEGMKMERGENYRIDCAKSRVRHVMSAHAGVDRTCNVLCGITRKVSSCTLPIMCKGQSCCTPRKHGASSGRTPRNCVIALICFGTRGSRGVLWERARRRERYPFVE